MVALVVGMLFCVVLAVVVVGLVAIPARRQGRDVLTARGEDIVAAVRETASRGHGTSQAARPDHSATHEQPQLAAGDAATRSDPSPAERDTHPVS
ncbi:MAG: hypothetical protein ACK5MP_01600 [Nostocoides sp.]